MSRLGQAFRNRRDSVRGRREINRALDRASTPAVRDDLRTIAQAQGYRLR